MSLLVRLKNVLPPASAPIGRLIAPTAFFVLLFASRIAWINDPDVFMHIRSGWWILEHHAIPTSDPFTLYAQGQPWMNHQWLSQVIIALLSARPMGGVVALSLWRAAAITFSFYLLFRAMRQRSVGNGIALLALFLGSLPAWPYSEPRPYLITYIMMAWINWAWSAWKTRGSKALLALPALMVFWVNCHGGAPIGLVYLGALVAGEGLIWAWQRLRRRESSARDLRFLTGILAATFIATLINPFTWRILLFPFRVVGKEVLEKRVFEWNAPTFEYDFRAYWIYLALFAVVGLARLRKLHPGEALASAGFIYLSLTARRHIPLMIYVTLPLLGANLQAIWSASAQMAVRRVTRPLLALMAALLVAYGAIWSREMMRLYILLGLGPNPYAHPIQAANYLMDSPLQPNLFHDYDWGGYLIWRLRPPWKAFIDGRVDIYGPHGVLRYMAMMRGEEGWRQEFAKYQINTVMLEYRTAANAPRLPQQLWESSDWALVYWDDVAFIYARRAPEIADYLARHSFHAVNPTWSTIQLARESTKTPAALARAMAELDRVLRENPKCIKAMDYQSNLLAEQGRADEAAALCRRMIAQEPKVLGARLRLARILDKQQKLDEAEKEYKAYLKLAPGSITAWMRLGTIAERRGQSGQAIRYYNKVLKMEPANQDAHDGLARVNAAGG